MGNTKRWFAARVAVAAAAVSLFAVPAASADPASIGAGVALDNEFNAEVYEHEPNTTAQVAWTGGGPHNVTSFGSSGGQSLFSSADVFIIPVLFQLSAPVEGTEFLAPGDYGFFCSIHPDTMRATLRVLGPPPRATTLPTPDAAYSGLAAKGKKKKCKKGKKGKKRRKCAKRKRRK